MGDKNHTSALAKIRHVTASCHAKLEGEVNWEEAFHSPSGYFELLQRFQRVVEPLESICASIDTSLVPDSPLSWRQRLRRDIRALAEGYGLDTELADTQLRPANTKFIHDLPTALGALYVLEGSALGGQMLSRQLRLRAAKWSRNLTNVEEGQPVEIDTYFMGRGEDTGLHWREFCQRLERELSEEADADAAAEAALTTFEIFRLSLTGKALCDRL